MRRRVLAALSVLPVVAGCDMVVLSPSGHIAEQQRDLLVSSTLLMLLIVVSVMGLTAYFAWRYSDKRRNRYDPEWSHSTSLELVIWAAPLMIVICLGAITWTGTHLLDPYRPLDQIGDRRPVPENEPPLEVQVVALDWKWLFIYPQYGVATVNDLAAPLDRPIRFQLTAQSVMNAFYVPALAGMIYAMPGMTSQLNAVINVPGSYKGFSSNYSGHGFSKMRFEFHGLSRADFDVWIAKARLGEGGVLDRARYLELAEPSVGVAPMGFEDVDPDLFRRIVNRCVEEGRLCMDQMMALDASGGTGFAGTINTVPAEGQASAFGYRPFHVAEFCTPGESVEQYGAEGVALLDPPPAATGAAAGDAIGDGAPGAADETL